MTVTPIAPARSIQWMRSGQKARLPMVVVGAATIPATSATAQPSTSAPISVAAHRGRWSPQTNMAAPTKSMPVNAPAARPEAPQAHSEPGTLRPPS